MSLKELLETIPEKDVNAALIAKVFADCNLLLIV